MRTLRNFSVQAALLLAASMTPTSAYSCALPGDSNYESRKQSHVRIHEDICSGKDKKAIAKVKAGVERQCTNHTKTFKSLSEKLKENPDDNETQNDFRSYKMLVDLTCDNDEMFERQCEDNYKRAIKCGYIEK